MNNVEVMIRNAHVVTVGGRSDTDLGIVDGKIAQLGGAMSGAIEHDAEGKTVTPGGVDAHVHLTQPVRDSDEWNWSDDFESDTHAAVAGGTTTVGNMSIPNYRGLMSEAIELDNAEARSLAVCDYFIHPVMMHPSGANLDLIPLLHKEGHTSIKFFLSFNNFDRNVNAFLKAMRVTRTHGGIALIHCEDAAIMECCCSLLREAGKTDPRFFPDARPVQAESVATHRAVGLSETTGCPSYIVRLASARALEACHEGRKRGVPVYVETRPLYLHLTRRRFEEEQGAKYAGAPPLREQSDVDAMCAGLQFGNFDTLATDHAPWTLAEKLDPAFDATNLRQGNGSPAPGGRLPLPVAAQRHRHPKARVPNQPTHAVASRHGGSVGSPRLLGEAPIRRHRGMPDPRGRRSRPSGGTRPAGNPRPVGTSVFRLILETAGIHKRTGYAQHEYDVL